MPTNRLQMIGFSGCTVLCSIAIFSEGKGRLRPDDSNRTRTMAPVQIQIEGMLIGRINNLH